MALARLYWVFAAAAVALAAAWLVNAPTGAFGGFWPARRALIYGTGVLAIGFMSLAVLLASRPVQVEGALGGLDKFYRLHRWFGVAAAALALAHWLLEIAPRSLARRGWLAPPPRRPAPAAVEAAGFDPFRDLHEPAAVVGEWAVYPLLVLVALALWRRFPYRLFSRAHRLLAAVYLALVFHGAVLLGRDYWTPPTGWLMALLLAGGSVAAGLSLFRRIGHSRKAVGAVESLTLHPGDAVLDVAVRLSTAWPGHRAGQFAFVDFGGAEGAHPFTITSTWRRDGRLAFSIKGLGDYTRALPEQLFVGQAATVEGPYGRFDFQGGARQVWVAGGVGITPFIAGLEQLGERGGVGGEVDLIYSTAAPDDGFIAHVRALAERAGARFHLLKTPDQGLLTLERLAELIPRWREADVWFCGPLGFGRALRSAMTAAGLPPDRFHQELFEMR